MTCAACQANVLRVVSKLPGVQDCDVNLLSGTMAVDFDVEQGDIASIEQAVDRIGYHASFEPSAHGSTKSSGQEASAAELSLGGPDAPGSAAQNAPVTERPVNRARELAWEEARSVKKRLIASICWLVPLMYVAMGSMLGLPLPAFLLGHENSLSMAFTQFLLTLPILYLNRSFFIQGFRSLIHRVPNMDALIAVGSGASALYGVFVIYRLAWGFGHGDDALIAHYHHQLYFEGAAMILTIITLGRFMEARSKGHTTDAISRLIELMPDEAEVLRDGSFVTVPATSLRPGDVVQVKSGASIPTDGVVLSGFTSIDESALTGESMPVEKTEGETVTGGTINRGGYFTFEVSRVGTDTTLAAIIQLVQEAATSKAPVARLADRVAAVFVPVVMGLAALVFLLWMISGAGFELALNMAISVLVISCPCALGLATPLAIMAGTGSGSRHGILIKSGAALETAHKISNVVLDKTGTITEGSPRVVALTPAPGVSSDELLRLAAGVEQFSEHVLAQAICDEAEDRGIVPVPAADFQAFPGMGVSATAAGDRTGLIRGGNLKVASEVLKDDPDQMARLTDLAGQASDTGSTPLFFFLDNKWLGLIALADSIKPTSPSAIRALKSLGLKVTMLTGDNRRVALAVQKLTGVDKVISDVLPDEKQRIIKELQTDGRTVAMVGDGINDAPALEQADVGIAIGSGTDVAIDAADIVLMKNDLTDVANAVSLSRKTMRNIRENLFWAFFYNILCIPLAAGAFYPIWGLKLSPMFGSAAMALSSLFVVGNALRLTRFKPIPAVTEPIDAPKLALSELGPTVDPDDAGTTSLADRPSNSPSADAGSADHVITDAGPTATTPADTATAAEAMNKKGEHKMKDSYILNVEGMMCQHCVAHVTKALQGIEGVSDVHVDLDSKTARCAADPNVAPDQLKAAVVDAGYEVTSVGKN